MSTKMRIAIIDDEADSRFLLRQELESNFPGAIEHIVEADSVYSGQQLLRDNVIDLLFLDIQLADGTGFNLLESLSNIDFTIVFVTAYSDFALRAFEFFTFAYLVKPFKQEELKRVVQQYLTSQRPNISPAVRVLSESIANRQIRKIVITEQHGFRILETSEVVYLQSDGNYTTFFLQDQEQLMCSKTLKEYDQVLQREGFFRTHRSYLVNLSHVRGYDRQDGGYIFMSNGAQIPISRRRIAAFREQFLG